ncbi:hypothetical protein BU16DRAFT_551840 [Lophium mytilinum]|uniref:Hemerythrin-like domain-containing protein n=1 Tax=Lophium mytilinum TaxID=390894 RepID=A0A6A6QI65_9PEZI|nr:hypothetical protein BU16DRAFT_551840 [Lophium mytilinum]
MKIIPTPFFQTGLSDQYTQVASEMALVHNIISRAFNGIYLQAPHVHPSEYFAFLSYCKASFDGLAAHHMGEETHAFPAIEEATGQKGLMGVNVAQHEAFHDGLHKWGAYISTLLAGDVAAFDAKTMLAIMDTFLEPLTTHLNDEIPTLLALREYGDSLDLKGIVEKEVEMVMGSLSKTTQLPLFLLNHDVTFEGGIHDFPPIPPPVRWALMRILPLVHPSWWKFASCDSSGMPRELYRRGVKPEECGQYWA